MLFSLALIFLVGLSFAGICNRIKIPRIVGMIFTGIILGPYVLNFFDSKILGISAELRQIALIIILLKAGLSLNISDLKKVGRPAILMSFLPATFEIIAYFLFAPRILNISCLEALIVGAVLAAVSPAIVVPRMIFLIENKYGTEKSIPQMILAGASCDDIFVIVIFSTFVAMESGTGLQVLSLLNIPISMALGLLFGGLIGLVMAIFFETSFNKNHLIKNSTKIVIILGVSFMLISLENAVSVPFSALLAIVSMACIFKLKSTNFVSKRLAEKFGKLWIAAEVILFVLVGSEVEIGYFLNAGFSVVLMIFIALAIRSIGVYISLLGTKLIFKERIFCIISYLPKATVQAAIGSIPLSLGLPCGKIVLTVAVLGILITAPLGAIGIDFTYKKLLEKNE